ncbi:MAG: hypothetical protein AAF495_25355 [Pseudomonadota bacterium]
MNIVIEQADFRRLSPQVQQEILEQLTGRKATDAARSGRGARTQLHWRKPVDLTPAQTLKLIHGLGDNHRRRLELMAKNGGRATVKRLLDVTGDSDLRVLAHFQSVVTRRLRRLIEDPEKKAELIKWDFDSTKWDRDGKTIVDGVYYCSAATASALQDVLTGGDSAKAKRPRARRA